ncbi:MAG: hypothetical protein QM489_07805 [Candidatus Izemoplasma sp.]
MKKQKLQTYDIKTYDIEMKYNKLFAPILLKIEAHMNTNETKSLKAHKDFLANEQKSKEKLNDFTDKSKLKEEKIKQVISNKITKLNVKERSIKANLVELKTSEVEKTNFQIDTINLKKAEFKKLEEIDILEIKAKYSLNVETYVEKLDAYNLNFEKNNDDFLSKKLSFHHEIASSVQAINTLEKEMIDKITIAKSTNQEILTNQVQLDEEKLQDADKELTKILNLIKKDTNVHIKIIKTNILATQKAYTDKNDLSIKLITQEIEALTLLHQERLKLIDIDTNIQVVKLNSLLETATTEKARSTIKDLKMKLNIINLRKDTIIKAEGVVLALRLKTLQSQIEKINEDSYSETSNTEKLKVFLVNDQTEIKDTGNYLRGLNLDLKKELLSSEFKNLAYNVDHESLKEDYINEVKQIFSAFKKELLAYNSSLLNDLFNYYKEIDEINKYLDTSEPLREIEVNNLKENIEISEIRERNNIKFAVSEHDILVLNKKLDKFNKIEEIKSLTSLSENNLLITDLKNKEMLDISLEIALLKYNKAKEIYKLRSNNTLLERALLTNNASTTLDINTQELEIAYLENAKSVRLENLDIKSQIMNIETEASYKNEVIEKRLEEELLKLDEKITANNYDKESLVNKFELEIEKQKNTSNTKIKAIKLEFQEKLTLIEKALSHEVKEPSQNILKASAVIDARFKKLDQNNIDLEDLIYSEIQLVHQDNLSAEAIKDIFLKDTLVHDFVDTYIGSLFESYSNASLFMSDLRDINITNNLVTTKEKSKIKKMKKQLSKQKIENEKIKKQIKLDKKASLNAINVLLNLKTATLKTLEEIEVENVKMIVTNIYQAIEQSLLNQYKIITGDIKEIYLPLTKLDQDKIDHAIQSKVKATSLVEKDLKTTLLPLQDELQDFLKLKDNSKSEAINLHKTNIGKLKKQVKELKDQALVDIRESNSEKRDLISSFDLRIETLKNVIDDRNKKSDSDHLQQKEDINSTLIARMNKLDTNDQEAQKIFNYEERIYNIAIETANARYIDSFQKISNLHSLNDKEHQKRISRVNQEIKEFFELKKHLLLKETTIYENNIFTVRPRLEESIGDAQRSIEKDIITKIKRRNSLLNLVDETLINLQNNKHLTYHDLYEQLDTLLTNNTLKYQALYQLFNTENNEVNNIIELTVSEFKTALFKLSKIKHERTVKDLMVINKNLKI